MSNDNPFQKNFEMWQEFSESYTKNMFNIFETNLEHSKAFQGQVQEAVNQAVETQFEMIMSGLKSVEAQIGELSKTMNEMAQSQQAPKNGKKS
jgi:uncharacterized coiled-coil protein SlyX